MSRFSLEYYWSAMEGKAPSMSPSLADIGQLGYWRTKSGSIAIWEFNDKIYCKHSENGKSRNSITTDLPEIRGFGFAIPVTYEDYTYHLSHGVWPGEIPGLGHNTKNLSGFQEWSESVDEQCRSALKWLSDKGGNLSTQVEADTAANHRDMLGRLIKKGESLLKDERQPLDDQLKEIRKRWGDVLATAEDAVKTLRDALSVFLRHAKRQEEQRVAEERKRREEERRAAEDQDIALAMLSKPEIEVKPKKVSAGGQLGKKAGLRTVKKAVITDYGLALEFFRHDPVISEAVQRLCAAEARSKTRRDIPGVEYVDEEVAI